MRRRFLICGLAILAALISLVARLEAQETRPARAAADVAGQVLDANATPVSGVIVCLCARHLDVHETKFPQTLGSEERVLAWPDGQSKVWFRRTDGEGRFSFPAQTGEKFSLLVSTDAGYAIHRRAKERDVPISLRLTPWATLEGSVTGGAGSAANRVSITARTRDYDDDAEPYLYLQDLHAKPDEQGRFRFERIPAGRYSVRRTSGQAKGVPVEVDAVSGRTTRVNVPAVGATVSGRLALPKDVPAGERFYIESATLTEAKPLARMPLPADMRERDTAGQRAAFDAWAATGDGSRAAADYAGALQRRMVRFKEDGSFVMLDVAPGDYTLPVQFFARSKEGRIDYDSPRASVTYAMTVAAPAKDTGSVDVGTLPVQPEGIAHRGQAAPDFAARTLDGRSVTLADFKGKVVLLDFWGTWCGVCVIDLPKLKAIRAEFGNDPRFVMLSLSVDDEEAKLRAHVLKHDMNWLHAALGDREQAWPAKLYQVSGYPSYWLIGTDGKVLYSDWRCNGLKAAVARALNERG